MSINVLSDRYDEGAILYCSTSDWAFGPVIYRTDNHAASERAEFFQIWARIKGLSLRLLRAGELESAWLDYQEAECKLPDGLYPEHDRAEDILRRIERERKRAARRNENEEAN